VLLLAALGALVAIAVSRGDDGPQTLVATSLPARTTVPRVPIFGTAPVDTTVPPIVPTVAPPPTTTGPKTTTLTTWTLADGYTLVLASTSEIAVNPGIYSSLTYDAVKDLIPVAMVASTPMVVVTSPSLPITSVTDLVKYARAKPGQVNVGSAGNGSFTHLAAELFRSMNGVTWTHVPYKGAPPALTDLASGRIDVMFSTLPAAIGMIRSNLIRPIAVSSRSRDASLPEVPTVLESGIDGYDVQYWYGVFVPAGVPKDSVSKLADNITQTLKSPDVIDSLAKQGATSGALTEGQFAGYVKLEVDKWGKVIKESGAKID